MINGVAVHHPLLLGLKGWQWVYIMWGIPALVLGVIVGVANLIPMLGPCAGLWLRRSVSTDAVSRCQSQAKRPT